MCATESRWRGRLMYQSHPSRESIFTNIPQHLVEATQNIQSIQFEDLDEMHRLIWELADLAAEWQPDLLPFFATGGIPYAFPLMRVLDKRGYRTLTDGKHFHIYPGLSWDGTIEGESAESYFASSFGELIRSSSGGDPVRVLVIDTTNTGNAVNKAVAACRLALRASGVIADAISLRIIGIVNTSHSESQKPDKMKSVVHGAIRQAHVITPSGVRLPDELHDRKFGKADFFEDDPEFSFELSYWLAGNVPTEDKSELIGIDAVHEELTTVSRARSGRLQIEYKNHETQQGTGLSHLPGRLIALLAMPLDAWQWEKMRQIDQLPTQSTEEREASAELRAISEGGLRLFELMNVCTTEAIDGLKKISRKLMDVEVYWLGTIEQPSQDIARKVCDSLEEGCCTSAEAFKYFIRAFPDLAELAPDDAEDAWWINQIRSLPKDSLRRYEPVTCSGVAHCVVEQSEDYDDFALDFVVLAGGVKKAQDLLDELQVKNWSMQQIKDHLDETWPITADKALAFHSPTDEQVALDFVLNCGGWAEARSCLRGWIANNTESS